MRHSKYIRISLLLTAAVCLTQSASAAEAASKRIYGVPVYGQYPELPAGCEATAVTMVMQWAGAKVSKVEVASAIAREPMLWRTGGTTWGGDPNQGFVGDPFKKESFGVFAKPMVDVIDRYLPGRGVDLTGSSLQGLLAYVDNGQPVAAWVTNKLQEPTTNAVWRTQGGDTITWRTPEHVMTIVGYTDTEIIVNDPANGTVERYDRARFQDVYQKMGRHALTIAATPQPKYTVYQGNNWLWEFPTLEGARQYAAKWDHAKVVEKATGLTKWDNYPSRVFQYGNYLSDFGSQTAAIGYAKQWDHARVIDVSTGKVTWSNWPKQVFQGHNLIKEFAVTDTYWAIEYAKGYADSRVVDGGTGDVLWRFGQ